MTYVRVCICKAWRVQDPSLEAESQPTDPQPPPPANEKAPAETTAAAAEENDDMDDAAITESQDESSAAAAGPSGGGKKGTSLKADAQKVSFEGLISVGNTTHLSIHALAYPFASLFSLSLSLSLSSFWF